MSQSMPIKVVWAVGVAFFAIFGAWALVSPSSFYDSVALFPPYNAHFLRDAGAFQLGIAAVLVAAASRGSGMLVALIGAAAASVLHAISHVVDADLGGRTSDHFFLWALALALSAGAFLQARSEQGRKEPT